MSGLVVLISGRGSNLKALCEKGLDGHIRCVISNKADAAGLSIAKQFGLTTKVIDHKLFRTREEFDAEVAIEIDKYNPDLIVLAGFMRILSSVFVERYKNRIINIHPSLLPAFVGSNAQSEAIALKVKVSGATVHLVNNQLDCGPILAQGVVPAYQNLTNTDLAQRILDLEHVIYPFIIWKFLSHQVNFHEDGTIEIKHIPQDKDLLKGYINSVFY